MTESLPESSPEPSFEELRPDATGPHDVTLPPFQAELFRPETATGVLPAEAMQGLARRVSMPLADYVVKPRPGIGRHSSWGPGTVPGVAVPGDGEGTVSPEHIACKQPLQVQAALVG